MGCYDPHTEQFQSVCRVMSGFSDAFYKEKSKSFLEDAVLEGKPSHYLTGEHPPVWLATREVWEIRGAELTLSPVHMAGSGLLGEDQPRGLSLRFPRFFRFRADKTWEEASSPSEVVSMFRQRGRHPQNGI